MINFIQAVIPREIIPVNKLLSITLCNILCTERMLFGISTLKKAKYKVWQKILGMKLNFILSSPYYLNKWNRSLSLKTDIKKM